MIFSANMIHAHVWNDETNMLAAMTDGKMMVWYYPNAVYVDKDLLPKTLYEKDSRCLLIREICMGFWLDCMGFLYYFTW